MPNLPLQIPLPLAALAAALYGAWLLWLLIVRGRVLQNKDEADTDRMLGLDQLPDPAGGDASLPQQLAAADLTLEPTTFTLIRAALDRGDLDQRLECDLSQDAFRRLVQ